MNMRKLKKKGSSNFKKFFKTNFATLMKFESKFEHKR